jgi:hypothetical protein
MPGLLALVLLIAGLAPGEAPEYAPAGEEAYTLDLEVDGYRNGYMPSDRLMTINGCTLERDAAYTFSLMYEAAEKDGIRLRAESCYRTYSQQDRAYNRRCPWEDVPIYGDNGVSGGKVQTGTKQVRVCTGPPTARAGKSNHGWGRAIDFTDGRGVLTCYDEEFQWLKLNAHRWGWVHPDWAHCGSVMEEAWHWEYAGVTAPVLVGYVNLDPALIRSVE